MRPVVGLVVLVATSLLAGSSAAPAAAVVDVAQLVPADAETVPVTHTADAADDPAIWVHPVDPASSLIIGNDKGGALETYNLDGTLAQRVTSATKFWGNVDVRQQVIVGARTLDVVATYNGGLRMFTVNSATRLLVPITDGTGTIATGGGEGLCLYESQLTGELSAFVIKVTGQLRQYRIQDDDGDGLLEATLVREFLVGSEAEGCVADDATGALYVSEEDVALWRYGAEPTYGATRTMVDQVQPNGQLSADVEGVTIVGLADNGGYLIASAQNVADPNHSYFTVYDRQTGAYLKSFRVVGGATADGCERTDGVAAYAGDLGPSFPFGLFVCQDNDNLTPGAGRQDFKLVRLEKVVNLNPVPGNALPIPSFTADCAYLVCTFDGSGSSDPDGTVNGHAWDFGDGSTDRGVAVVHTYASPGPRTVTLTAIDNDYAAASTTQPVNPTTAPGTGSVSFVSAASTNTSQPGHKVVVPAETQAGDVLLLMLAGNKSTTTITNPPGWTPLQQSNATGAVGRLWVRVATASDAGSVTTVTASASMKADLTVAAYRGTGANPVDVSAAAADTTARTTHTTPAVTTTQGGDWLVSYWADKSSAATGWTLPTGVTRRAASTGTAAGHITATLADSDTGLPVGTAGGRTATTGVSSKAVMFTVALAPG